MIAKYEDIEVYGENQEQCIFLVKEAKGTFDSDKNEVILGKIDETKIEFTLSNDERKMNTDYNGTSVSLTSKDAVALLQIKTAFELGAKRTIMKFKNGTNMEMTPAIFAKFAPWFVGKRNEFFQ